jgi:hypothetical protein
MWNFVKYSYNYLRLGYTLHQLYTSWSDTQRVEVCLYEQMVRQVQSCGAVAIKFIQWFHPLLELRFIDEDDYHKENYKDKLPWWIKKLEIFYENCDIHSFDYTIQEYKRSFDRDLMEEYDILDVLGSGSIGQVYLVQRKGTTEKIVMKIVHPDIDVQIDSFEFCLKYMYRIPKVKSLLETLSIDLFSFIKCFRKQQDMVKEGNNLLKMYTIYKDNPHIHIPELYGVSENILLMEYIEGCDFDKLQCKPYEKLKIYTMFYLFMRNNITCENFNHGDLHSGNWKVHEDRGIVVYDYGFCWSAPSEKKHTVDKAIIVCEGSNLQNRDQTIKLVSELMFDLLVHEHIQDKSTLMEKICEYVKSSQFVGMCEDEKDISISPINIFQLLTNFCIINHVMIDYNLIQFLIIFIQIQRHCITYGYASSENDTIYPDIKIYKERYANCLNFCRTYNVYPKYANYIKNKLNELQVDRTSIFDTVDFSDEIRKLAVSKI